MEKPVEALLDQEGGDAARAGVRIGLGIDHQHVGIGPVGDPHLAAVQHVAVAALLGARAHAHHVGAGARLAHRQRADMLAGDQLRQIAPLLRLGAVAADLVDAEIGMRAVGQPDRGRGAADLLHRHDMLEIAHAGAAVFLLDGDAEHAERAELAPEVGGEVVVAVDGGGARRDLVGGEGLDLVAQHVGGLAEVEVQAGQAVWQRRHQVSLCRLDGLDHLEAFELRMPEIEAAVLSGIAVCAAECLRSRPCLEVVLVAPDRVR